MENTTQNFASLMEGTTSSGWQKIVRLWPDAVAILVFFLISFFYFQKPVTDGLILGGHDNDGAVGMAQDRIEYQQQTGEVSRWTNSAFSGMPTYQIAPGYESSDVLDFFAEVYGLGTSGALCYVFLYLLGFYILMRAFNFKVWLSALGAIVWAFSSYFFIIIAAGHIWKVMTLAFIPPTIAGLVLCYRGKLLWGGAVTALFTAFQILSNHAQMSYYFFFVMACIAVAYGVSAFMKRKSEAQIEEFEEHTANAKSWLKATGVILIAGMIGVMANLPNLYHTQEYAKESMRGKAELTPLRNANKTDEVRETPKSGLDFDYITGWSYGVGETFTLMIPDFKGGGSGESMLETPSGAKNDSYLYQVQMLAQQLGGSAPGLSCYWGEQPGTVGPVYVGAIICFLFVLGLFYVRGPMKWALLIATLISFVFAWGRNIPDVTHFLINNLPLYNKFRTVSSALVIAEFTMPLLAMMCLAKLIRRPETLSEKNNTVAFYFAFALTGGICLLFWIAPGLAGDCINMNEADVLTRLTPYQAQLGLNLSDFQHSITDVRHGILAASAGRSFLFILFAAVLIVLYTRVKAFKGWMLCAVLIVTSLFDMWGENKRYLNDDCFQEPTYKQNLVQKTPADEYILADTDPEYRVCDIEGFETNRSGYYHKMIGGYHAAKLRRYQDLIERHIRRENKQWAEAAAVAQNAIAKDTLRLLSAKVTNVQQVIDMVSQDIAADSAFSSPVLNMLNTKYLIFAGGATVVRNYKANGNAWFVQSLDFVKGADAEMAGLTGLDTKTAAVADEKFKSQLDGSALGIGSAKLTNYAINELHYDIHSEKGGVVVFSEIYYPGWTATIDGQEVELGRVNYVLRALKVPAGSHQVVLEFRPDSVSTTNGIAYIAIALIVLGFLSAIYFALRKKSQE